MLNGLMSYFRMGEDMETLKINGGIDSQSERSESENEIIETPKYHNRMNHFDDYIRRNKGKKYPDFTPEEVQIIRRDFEEFVNAYYELSPFDIEGSAYTSFLGMDFVICKLCDKNRIPINNRDGITKCFQNMRKMAYHESITKKVFNELGWKFVPWNFSVE
jgi:hypothetical protein